MILLPFCCGPVYAFLCCRVSDFDAVFIRQLIGKTISLISLSCSPYPVLAWKLATGGPGLFGSIERVSDYSALNKGFADNAFISGDTPLKSGKHAWRVTVDGLGPDGGDSILGIIQADKALPRDSYNDVTFFGIDTVQSNRRRAAGRFSQGSGLGEIRSGDKLDFLLDIEKRTFTVITLKDGKSCVFNVPDLQPGWVPHFHLYRSRNQVSIELIPPEQAGNQ